MYIKIHINYVLLKEQLDNVDEVLVTSGLVNQRRSKTFKQQYSLYISLHNIITKHKFYFTQYVPI